MYRVILCLYTDEVYEKFRGDSLHSASRVYNILVKEYGADKVRFIEE